MTLRLSTFAYLLTMVWGSASWAQSQTPPDSAAATTGGKLAVQGYLDAYYAYDFNKPAGGDRPYFVSMNRHNEMTVNLACVALQYTASRVRARVVPGFGTYMNANYQAEPGSLKNLVEANAGVRLWPNKDIWLDAGILSAPYTNESAISRDHLAYTRSLAPEYVPYYVSGVKLSIPLSSVWQFNVYVVNGWQQIQDQNANKSVGTHLEYKPNQHWSLNWTTYAGNEASATDSTIGSRLFHDVYFVYTSSRWTVTGCAYVGRQAQAAGQHAVWWQANFIGRYQILPQWSVTGRIEYFQDEHGVQVASLMPGAGFRTASSSVGVNWQLADHVLLRAEGRTFFSDRTVYRRDDVFVRTSNLLTLNMTVWF